MEEDGSVGTWQIQGGQRFSEDGEPLLPGDMSIAVKDLPDRIITLRETDVVFPGLADFHVHVRPEHDTLPTIGVASKELLSSGVMLVGDAGTRGWEHFSSSAQDGQLPMIKVWLSVIKDGLAQHPYVPYFDGLTDGQSEEIFRTINCLGDERAGLKIRLGQHDLAEDQRLWKAGLRLARYCKVPLMVHITGTFLPLEEILEALEGRDVITHVFHGQRGSLTARRRLVNALFDTVAKGVILDVGHGSRHFSWSTFFRLYAEGLRPHMISTDLTGLTWRKSPVYDLAFLCSKLVAGGLSWPELYQGVVKRPFEYYSAHLPSNSVVVLRYWPRRVKFYDLDGHNVIGNGMWRPVLVMAQGQVIKDVLI